MLTDRQLARLRSVATSAMVDTCTVVRPSAGRGQLDPVTLRYPDAPAAPVYAGVCEIERPGGAGPQELIVGEAERVSYDAIVKLPSDVAAAADVRRGDVIRLDTSAHTPALVERSFTVRSVADSTWSTKRRLLCTEGV